MKPNYVVVVLAVAAAMTGVPSYADDRGNEERRNRQIDSGMQDIANAATVGQPGHAWRYFADARKVRSVAISPRGDYFYSDDHGKGPVLVFKATGTP